MGRRPKPLADLELSGALKARPGRYKARLDAAKAASHAPIAQSATIPTKPAPLGSAPKHLDADQKAIWRELAKTYPKLTHSDRFHLEIAVKLTHKMRTAVDGLKGQELSQLLSILDRFAPGDGYVPSKDTNPDPIPTTIPAPVADTRTEYERKVDEFFDECQRPDEEDREIRKEMQATGKTYYQIKVEREARTA